MEYNLPTGKFPVVLADFPWPYTGNPNKDQSAAKHYNLMTEQEIYDFPMRDLMLPKSILFMWATGPKLHLAIKAIESYGLHYRGVAFIWAKTNVKGQIINGQGARPSLVKSMGEFVLWASPVAKGRPLPIKSERMAQFLLEPRPQNVHSRKPETIQDRIDELLDGPKLELFARRVRPGWTVWGNEITSEETSQEVSSVVLLPTFSQPL